MIKTFEEFVNEGLISDYKKKEEIEKAKKSEISVEEKSFVFEVLKSFDDVEMPYVLVCNDCCITGIPIKDKYVRNNEENIKRIKFNELNEDEFKKINITRDTRLHILKVSANKSENHVWFDDSYEIKEIWKSIYKWFIDAIWAKASSPLSPGKVTIDSLLGIEDKIKKELL